MSTVSERRDSATRFFWAVLIAASSASVAGNVAHAFFNHAANNTVIAALASAVPPAVLLAATHGLSLMVRSAIVGKLYQAALSLLLALAGIAFVLSFNALRELAIEQAGISSNIAWLWPLAIDLSVTQATIALLAITSGERARAEAIKAGHARRKVGKPEMPEVPEVKPEPTRRRTMRGAAAA